MKCLELNLPNQAHLDLLVHIMVVAYSPLQLCLLQEGSHLECLQLPPRFLQDQQSNLPQLICLEVVQGDAQK